MKLCFPSQEFDAAVAAVCHGSVSDEQARALNELLRRHPAAKRRIHSARRIAFAAGFGPGPLRRHDTGGRSIRRHPRIVAKSCPASIVTDWATASARLGGDLGRVRRTAGQRMVGMARVAAGRAQRCDQQGGRDSEPGGGCAVELRRRSTSTGSTSGPGLASAQIGFGTGGFLQRCAGGDRGAGRISDHFTQRRFLPHGQADCRGSAASARVSNCDSANARDRSGHGVRSRRKAGATELHVFKGSVEFLPAIGSAKQSLQEGTGAVAESSRPPRLITANEAAFASLFELRDKSVAAESSRYDQWRAASFGSIKTPRCSCISTSKTPRLQTGGCTTRAPRVLQCPTAPSSAANGSRVDGRPNKRWSFAG